MMCRPFLPFTMVFVYALSSNLAQGQDDLHIWREFILMLKHGQVPANRIRPHEQLGEEFKRTLLGYLDSVRAQAAQGDWTAEPEAVRIDDRVQYITPWSTRGDKVTYCFSFIMEDSQWYFQHLEAIFIRLDKTPQPPTSDFPDISEVQKNWAREEIYWSYVVTNFYLPLAREKGQEYALSMLKDGGGYFVGAKTWVPFSAPRKAFILYLCWEQAKLRGNDVALSKLDETEAIVQLSTQFFALYFTASHLRPRISLEDYKRIFETIWQDRASSAGWNLDIQYAQDYRVTFHFKRSG
jgi:hypothetical protein